MNKKKQTKAELEIELANTRILFILGKTMSEFEILEDSIQKAADLVASELNFDRINIITFDMEARAISNFSRGGPGYKESVEVQFNELEEGLSGWVLKTLETALSPKGKSDVRESPSVQERRKATNCGAIIVAPILYHNTILGTITAINRPDQRDFTQSDADLLMAIASQIGILIQNSRLYQNLRQETERRIEEAHFHSLLENMPVGYHTLDVNGSILHINQTELNWLGYSRNEVIGIKTIHDLLTPSSQSKYKGQLSKLIEEGSIKNLEVEFICKNGKTYFASIHVNAVQDQKGKVLYFDSTVVDVTEIKLVETARQKTEEQYRSIFENASIGIFHSTTEGRFLRVNPALANMMGYRDPKEMITLVTNIGAQIYVDSHLRSEIVSTTQKTDGWTYAENRYRRKNGSIMTGNLSVRKVLREDGTLDYLEGFVEDITARKEAETSLLENKQSLEAILNAATESIFLMDITGQVLSCNQTTASRFGKRTEDIIGKCIYDFLPTDLAASRKKQVSLALKKGLPSHFEDERSGAWIENTIYPIHDSDGLIRRIAIYGRDITENKRAEAALRTSESNYRSIMEQASDGIFIADAHGNYVDVNESGCLLLGYKREEILRLKMIDLIPLEDRAPIPIRYDLLQTGTKNITERRLLRKDGTNIAVEISSTKLQDGRLQGMVRDITQRKQMEKKLLESERLFRAVFAQSPVGKLLNTPDGRLRDVNQTFADMLGYTEKEIHSREIEKLIHPDDLAISRNSMQVLLEGGRNHFRMEMRYLHKNSRIIWTDVGRTLLRDESGTPLCFITTVMDITERHQVENLLRQYSFIDELTGLYNRRGFLSVGNDHLKLAHRDAKELAVFFSDVDDLKSINDNFGHNIGDQALIATSKILKNIFRASDIIARIGGDEFAIMARNVNQEDTPDILSRLRSSLKTFNQQNEYSYKLSISIGAAYFHTQSDLTIEELLAEADSEQYKEKKKKKK